MKKNWHIGLLLAAGILIIYLLMKGIPQRTFATILGEQTQPEESSPSEGLANTSVVNTSPGINQTYNLPNAPVVTQPDSNAQYLTPDQLNASLNSQAPSVIQNVLSVGADYSEFIPASQNLEN